MDIIYHLIAVRKSSENEVPYKLQRQGFNKEEAENMTYLVRRLHNYRTLGFMSSAAFSYYFFRLYSDPAKRLRKPIYLACSLLSLPVVWFSF